MTTPHLSSPVLVHPEDLKANRELTTQITNLANDAFKRAHMTSPQNWDCVRLRFPTLESYYDMLAPGSVVALIFDMNALQENTTGGEISQRDGERAGKVVACATAVLWKGGWAREGAGHEIGWEIKAVSVDGEERYLHKGLAVKVMAALESRLVENAKRQGKTASPANTGSKTSVGKGCLSLWIMAAECLNGAYWRKRGYKEVRRSTEEKGTWDCKTSFELVVFRKDVEYDM